MSDQLEPAGARMTLARSVAALQAGTGERGDVLLVPGYTGSKEDFAPLLTLLAETGLRVTAIDLPGQYETPGPSSPADYTPDALGRAVGDVARELGAPVHLLGHSFGGLVSRAAAIGEPELFRSLVLLCSGPAALAGVRRQRMEALEPLLAAHGLEGVHAAMVAAEQGDPGYLPVSPELAEFLRRRFLASSAAGLQGMGDALRAEPDRVEELAATGIPVLVACGPDDDAWPPRLQRQMAERLGAPFVLIPDAAHSPAIENPAETVRELLAFWTAP
jgi:pimeloyl-ACP methyl ester carboxylesterase